MGTLLSRIIYWVITLIVFPVIPLMIYMLGCVVIEWVESSVDDTINHIAENLEEVGRTIGQT